MLVTVRFLHDEISVLAVLSRWGKNELAEKVMPKWLVIFKLVSGSPPFEMKSKQDEL